MSMSTFPPKGQFNATNYAQNVIKCEMMGPKKFSNFISKFFFCKLQSFHELCGIFMESSCREKP
jgi:hypothetical protein